MIEMKQLQFFIACAETGSFSKAAERLYTTQPNVSKVIGLLEKEVNASLFRRGKNGITLTDKGKHVYEYASRVMDDLDFMRDFSDTKEESWLRISCSPSSKFADLFVEFYQLHEASDLHYRVYSTDMNHILQRLRDNKDDIGFIYLEEEKRQSLEYLLMRYHLEFIPLKKVESMLYIGEMGEMKELLERIEKGERVKLIQSYYDEIRRDKERTIVDKEGREIKELDPVIITNSDYITQRILRMTDLANISGGDIVQGQKGITANVEGMELRENGVLFGFLCRKSENLSKWATEFVRFLKGKMA